MLPAAESGSRVCRFTVMGLRLALLCKVSSISKVNLDGCPLGRLHAVNWLQIGVRWGWIRRVLKRAQFGRHDQNSARRKYLVPFSGCRSLYLRAGWAAAVRRRLEAR